MVLAAQEVDGCHALLRCLAKPVGKVSFFQGRGSDILLGHSFLDHVAILPPIYVLHLTDFGLTGHWLALPDTEVDVSSTQGPDANASQRE